MKLEKLSAAAIVLVFVVLVIAGLIGWLFPTHPRLATIASVVIGLIMGWFLRDKGYIKRT
jgi:hypothetical protein